MSDLKTIYMWGKSANGYQGLDGTDAMNVAKYFPAMYCETMKWGTDSKAIIHKITNAYGTASVKVRRVNYDGSLTWVTIHEEEVSTVNYGIYGDTYNIGFVIDAIMLCNSSSNVHWHYMNSAPGTSITFDNYERKSVTVSNLTTNSPIHKQNFVLKADVTHVDGLVSQYKILKDGVQFYPPSGYTGFSTSPNYHIEHSFLATDFKLGSSKIELVVTDKNIIPKTVTLVTYASRISALPTASGSLSAIIVHKDNVKLTASISDPDLDRVQYKVNLNGITKLDWTNFQDTPFNITPIIFLNSDLNLGSNTVTIEVKDDLGVVGTAWAGQVSKINYNPVIDIKLVGLTITIDITDGDLDRIKYKATVNGKNLVPVDGTFSEYYPTPFTYTYKLNPSQVNLLQLNRIRVEVYDDYGAFVAKDFDFIADYAGLLFTDNLGTYYTTDIGEMIKYLDLGTIVAGQTTTAERIWLKNTLGYPVKNIALVSHNFELDGDEVWLEISNSNAPFERLSTISHPELLPDKEKIPFYVRVASTRKAKRGGMFKVTVRAEPT